MPLSILPTGVYSEGDNVTDIIGVTKYDPELTQEQKISDSSLKKKNKFISFLLKFKLFRKLILRNKNIDKSFPSWIAKTDEERVQNLTNLYENERDADTRFSVTEKIDGCSATYFLKKKKFGYEFGVCSRNFRLVEDNSHYWKVARKYKIKSVLKNLIQNNKSVVLQGEIIGDSIQGNKYHINGLEFYAFNFIYDNNKISTIDMIFQKLLRFQKENL